MYDTIEQQLMQQQQQQGNSPAPVVTDPQPPSNSQPPADPQPPVDPQPPAGSTPKAVNDQITDSVTQINASNSTDPADPADLIDPTDIPWYEKTEEPPAAKPVDPKPVDPAPVVDEDEDIKLLKEFKKSGKTLKDFVSEMNVPDYATMDDATIVELGLQKLEGFTGDDYASAVEEFNQMSLFQRKKLVQEYRNSFIQQSEQKLKQLTQVSATNNDKFKQTVQRFETEVDQIANEITGKEMYGFKVTDEMSTKIKTFLKKEIALNRADGSIDAELMADFALWRLYGKDIVRANVTAAKNAGRKEMLIATTNPSSGGGPSNSSAGMKSTGPDDAFTAYLNAKKR
jgi:hypothetical protein